jgi:hypothetical protein
MRAYLIENPGASPRFATVEADAKRAAREAAGTVTPTEIPDTKRDLVPWLNELLQREVGFRQRKLEQAHELNDELLFADTCGDVEAAKKPRVAGFCDACGQSAEGKLKLARGTDLDAFSAWLGELQLGDLWAMQRAGELIGERARELGAEYQERTVQ